MSSAVATITMTGSPASASFAMVEALLHEFYQSTTPNARKQQIEGELLAFKSQPNAWHVCLQAATSFETNQFVWFFCTSTLSYAITRRWAHLSQHERKLLRETLWHSYAHLPPYGVARNQRDTFAQLIAQMGKREFPTDHPEYVLHCIELIKSKFTLGINLLRATSEEAVSNRDDVTMECKQRFHDCLSMCLPEIMDLLTKYLIIAVCYINGKNVLLEIPNNLMDYSLTASLPNDNQLSPALVDLLACVQHFVTWSPTSLISEYFLMSILDLAQWRQLPHQELSLHALTILNELLYLQKSIPHPTIVMRGINGLLEQFNNHHRGADENNGEGYTATATTSVSEQHEMYNDKFRELLRLYTCKYWSKMLQEPQPLDAFLKSLLKCTVDHRNGALDFTEKLEIWSPLIKGLSVHTHTKYIEYAQVFHKLVEEIIKRTQFRYNKAELELLEMEAIEDSVSSEWQHFLTQCIECIALVGEVQPEVVFSQCYSFWSCVDEYLNDLEMQMSRGKNLLQQQQCASLGEYFRDYATTCQAVTRVAPLLRGDHEGGGGGVASDGDHLYTQPHMQLLRFMEHLFDILKFLTGEKLFNIIDKFSLQAEADHLIAQVLMAIKSLLPITLNFTFLDVEHLLTHLFEIVVAILVQNNANVTAIVYQAASQVLVCIGTVMRPKFLLSSPTLKKLMASCLHFTHLPKDVVANIYISIIGYHILPAKGGGGNANGTAADAYALNILNEFIAYVTEAFHELQLDPSTTATAAATPPASHASNETKVTSITCQLLSVLKLVIEHFHDSTQSAKEQLAKLFRPVMTKALLIYSQYGAHNNAITIQVAEFNLSLLRALATQLGLQYIREMITLFIAVLSKKDQAITCQYVVMERTLQMFQLIVEQPGNASNVLLSSILDFSLDQILPLLQQQTQQPQQNQKAMDNTDITLMLYQLFDCILQNKWQYFYKSTVHQNGSLHQFSSNNLHPEHFTSILNAYGHILVNGKDPAIVRLVLQSLQSVNERWRLYQRPLFKEHLLSSFQKALINALLSGEGHLHFEQLGNALYDMGQVDSLKLRESFVSAGLPVNSKTVEDLCNATDIPTFAHKLQQLLQDAHCVDLSH